MEERLVAVADMYVQCSLQTHNFYEPGFAMSDCCRRPATSAVVFSDDGRKMWRCDEHKGVRRIWPSRELGDVVTEIVRETLGPDAA